MFNNIYTQKLSNVIAILPAAGIGSRMHNVLPKQYITICNKTILEHSLNAILQQSCIYKIIIVINVNDHWFNKLLISSNPLIKVVIGGLTRSESVMAALRYLKQAEWILIHDAVRPCLRQEDLCRLFEVVNLTKIGGILAAPVKDTIKCIDVNTKLIKYTIKNSNLWHALTPQLFMYDLLKSSLEKVLMKNIIVTDEAEALEYCGYKPLLVPGYPDNIKITHPEDLVLAKNFLTNFLQDN